MALPTITALPPAPQRGEAPATFSLKANNWVAAIDAWTTEVNTLSTEYDDLSVTVEGYRDDAQLAATDAAAQVALAETARTGAEAAQTAAELAETGAESFKDSAETAAAAAQAAAGLPSLAGNAGKPLRVRQDESGVEWAGGESSLTKTFSPSEQFIWKLSSPVSGAPIVSLTKEVPQTGVTNGEWETAISDSEFDVEAGLQFGASGLEIDLTGGTYVGQYLVATTNTAGQISTDYWTDINSMTSDDVENGEFISYAISDDGKQSFYVVRNGEGSRSIARDNAGTWEYNSSASYGTESWSAAATNTLVGAIKDAVDTKLDGYDITVGKFMSGFDLDLSATTGLSSVDFSDDYTKMLVCFSSPAIVREYTLSTAGDPSTATETATLDISGQVANPASAKYADSGNKVIVLSAVSPGTSDALYQYNLLAAYDIDGGSYSGNSFTVGTQAEVPIDFCINAGSTRIIVTDTVLDALYQYNLTGGDLSTMSYSGNSLSVSSQSSAPTGLSFGENDNQLFMASQSNSSIFEYNLPTGGSLSGASYTGNSLDVSAQVSSPRSCTFVLNGLRIVVADFVDSFVHSFDTATSLNVMGPNQLSAATDADFPIVTDTLDLAIVLRTDDGGTTPTTSGVTINYDANVAKEVAVNGTDYTFQLLSSDRARITWIAGSTDNVDAKVIS